MPNLKDGFFRDSDGNKSFTALLIMVIVIPIISVYLYHNYKAVTPVDFQANEKFIIWGIVFAKLGSKAAGVVNNIFAKDGKPDA